MPGSAEEKAKRHCMPIIHTRGTHYEVGYDIGKTFGAMIQALLIKCEAYINLPAYETPAGYQAYEDTLAVVRKNFPQYVDEIQGFADGAQVPFFKLFLLHMDDITPCVARMGACQETTGCSTVCVNNGDQQILGHNEDVVEEMLDMCYLVSAHIISDRPQGRWLVSEERFTSLCYAGHLPGYTMGYNHHGLIYTINTISADVLLSGKTPRYFITRALLAAENFDQAQNILRDLGCGAANGCSINMTFLQEEGDTLFHNAEMGPAYENNESQLSIFTARPGETISHFNMYLRLPVKEVEGRIIASSLSRMNTYNNYDTPITEAEVIEFLGDESSEVLKVFQMEGPIRTTATGIFDCNAKTWSIYTDNPRYSEPLVVLPLLLKTKKGQ